MAAENGLPQLSKLRLQPQGSRDEEGLRRMVDGGHPPRAADVTQLRAMQKSAVSARGRDEQSEQSKAQSLSETLRSSARGAGPRVVRSEPRPHDDRYQPSSPRVMNLHGSGFIKAMSDAGLKPTVVYHNLSVAELYEKALQHEPSAHIVAGGALAVLSGAKTGRSPQDKRVVRDPSTEGDVWWGEGEGSGSPNYEMDERSYQTTRERAVDYLNQLDRLYVCDGYAACCREGGDAAAAAASGRLRVRVVCARPSHALFTHNILIRPTEEELAEFGRPHITIYDAGPFPANRFTSFMTSSTSISISLKHREMVILGTMYAGCIKAGIFTLLTHILPQRGVLPLQAGCNVGKGGGDATLFFGLSGTGKTTLSADATGARRLVSDDEAGWGDDGVFNLEGGCYAKCIGLRKEADPLIAGAIRYGALLENVVFGEEGRQVDFDSAGITENTRAAYPIEHIANAKIPCVGGHPKNIIMLCCDAFGVLPPVAKLTREQAMYYFISGFTARVMRGEHGDLAPDPTFSACFAASFLIYHPAKYAAMFADRLEQHGTRVWLINTGWTGGSYGVGRRIQLAHTRAIVDAIHSGELEAAAYTTLPTFNLQVPTACSGVPPELLLPAATWVDREAYGGTLGHLAALFVDNFRLFLPGLEQELSAAQAQAIAAAGPTLQ